MIKMENVNKYKHFLIPAAILCFSIIGFYILIGIYNFNFKKSRTFIINKNSFEDISSGKNGIDITKVTKLDVPYPIVEPDILNNNSLIFTSYNITGTESSISILDFNNNDLSVLKIDGRSNLYGIRVSPDGGKLLVNAERKNSAPQNCLILYDMESSKVLNILYDATDAEWFPDGSGFIGISAKNIFHYTLKGSRKDIISGSDILKKCDPETYKSISQKGEYVTFKYIYDIKLSADGNRIYFKYNNGLYNLDIKNGKLSNIKLMEGDGSIDKYIPLNNGNILFIRNAISGNSGMYIYDSKSKIIRNLLHGNIKLFDVSRDNKRIAYEYEPTYEDNKEVDRSDMIYAAYLDGYELVSPKVICREYSDYAKWSIDGKNLFVFGSRLGGTRIYKFAFDK